MNNILIIKQLWYRKVQCMKAFIHLYNIHYVHNINKNENLYIDIYIIAQCEIETIHINL